MQQADAKCGKQGACWVTMIVQGRVMGLRIADMRMCVDMLPAIVRMRMNVDNSWFWPPDSFLAGEVSQGLLGLLLVCRELVLSFVFLSFLSDVQ